MEARGSFRNGAFREGGMKTGRKSRGADGRVVVARGLRAAMAAAAACPGGRIDVFEPTWRGVDRARRIVEAAGLSARVHVWHACAAGLVRRALGRGARAA